MYCGFNAIKEYMHYFLILENDRFTHMANDLINLVSYYILHFKENF